MRCIYIITCLFLSIGSGWLTLDWLDVINKQSSVSVIDLEILFLFFCSTVVSVITFLMFLTHKED